MAASGVLGMAAGIGGAVVSQGMGRIFAGADDRRQLRQQKALNAQAVESQKEMADYNWNNQFKMMEATSYDWQKGQMEKAGLNPALMYGQGGGGGATTGGTGGSGVSGGQAANAAATQGAATQQGMGMLQAGMMQAQIENMKANTEKTKVDTAKTAGVDTASATEDVQTKKFNNEVNQLIGAAQKAKNYDWITQKLETSATKELAEWEAYNSAGFAGKTTDDPSSPVAKAIKAGLDNVVVDLKNARTEGNIKEAEETIKAFEAGLAKQGIPPNSPWGVKIIVDLLKHLGLGIGGAVESAKGVVDTAKKIIP